jgi:hypothetical protein
VNEGLKMKVKTTRVKTKPGKSIVVRTTRDERRRIESKANEYTEGDLSKWIRFSSMNFVPKKHHFE